MSMPPFSDCDRMVQNVADRPFSPTTHLAYALSDKRSSSRLVSIHVDKHRSQDASNNNLQEQNEDPATRTKQKKTDAWKQHEKSVRQSEKRRATAQEKAARKKNTLEQDIFGDEPDATRSSSHRSSQNGKKKNFLAVFVVERPLHHPAINLLLQSLPKRTHRNSEDEEEADPEADEVEAEDEHRNTRARKTIRKPTTKVKAFEYHQVIAEVRKDSLQEMFELQRQNILTLQETEERSKQYIAQVQQKLYKAARKAAGFHDEEPLDPKTSVSANVWAASKDLDNDIPLEK
ncbi:hypothetical protein SISNIDRAFT_491906 [Sistotremastrum niveocremeum HHB9708]|uniref:Uncharacterized protein n=1 Tax=Sistotremastrum niveocremeum HHB9708 TaxID=1314777 RepID=A0A164M9F3_9AGAM|nr:hypothetical protein SISNIDRAFT_491906 [Sistotremastrum niveocremeum HHB9708]